MAPLPRAERDPAARRHRRHANLMLVLVTAAWGLTFPAIHEAVRDTAPLVFTALRMTLAAVGLFLLLRGRLIAGWKGRFLQGCLLAATFYGSYAFQAIGLQYTSASRSAFITGLSVVLVPLFHVPIRRHVPGVISLAGVVLCFAGLFLITRPDLGGINKGDILTLGCALTYAFYIIFLESFSRHDTTDAFIGIQTVLVALLALLAVPLSPDRGVAWSPGLLIGLAITAPVAMFTIIAITRYQPRTTATQAAVIYSAEPLFALLFSMIWLGESLDGPGLVGAALMIGGVLLVIWR